jgi:ATP-dependent RNA helicase DDX23/PRP28
MGAEDKRKADGGDSNAKRAKVDSKPEVMSLEQMLAKRKEEKKAPKLAFVSKNEREKNAEKEASRQKTEAKKKNEEASKRRKDFLLQEEIERERERQREREERERERKRREEERQREREEREKERLKQREEKDSLMQSSSLAEMNLLKLPETERRERQAEKELELIKRHYLGMKDAKKKMQKPSEKFRNIFNFEWNADDDTMRGDNNPLYTKRCEPQLLFGRGYRAGIDVREQRKNNSFYEELIAKRAEYTGEDVSTFIQPQKETASFKTRDIEVKDDHKIHWTDKPVQEMNTRDWRIFREDFQIFIRGGRVPNPMRIWAEGPLPWELLEAIHKVGYAKPTPVQMQTIPIACQCRDLIAVAETGSGKTAAYMLPLLSYVKKLPPLDDHTAQDGPYAIVLAPSRELVLQIEEESIKFSSFLKTRLVSVVGGRDAEQQAFQLRQGCEICLATPGRLCDALDKRHTVLNQCNYVVIDEADKMVDLGFEDYVRRALLAIPNSNMKSEVEDDAFKQEVEALAGTRKFRITQMFSATMPPAIERMARTFLRHPSIISVGDPGHAKKDIEQRLEFLGEAKKKKRLEELLVGAEPPIIVFVNQKKAVDVLAKSLDNSGYRVCSLHGGKSQEQREWAMNSFKEGRYDILVATDVAGRGLDVEGVQQVINFDMPKTIEDYTHRIGRTGRAGLKGLAMSFLTPEDSEMFYDLTNFLKSSNQIVPPELANHPASKFKPGTLNEFGQRMGTKLSEHIVYAKR